MRCGLKISALSTVKKLRLLLCVFLMSVIANVFMLPGFADSVPESVYTVEIDGVRHGCLELVEIKHLGKTNWKQFWKKPQEYRVYRLLTPSNSKASNTSGEKSTEEVSMASYESNQFLVVSPERYEGLKNSLKEVPDNRTYEKKYPYKTQAQDDFRRWGGLTNFGLGIMINMVQLIK